MSSSIAQAGTQHSGQTIPKQKIVKSSGIGKPNKNQTKNESIIIPKQNKNGAVKATKCNTCKTYKKVRKKCNTKSQKRK